MPMPSTQKLQLSREASLVSRTQISWTAHLVDTAEDLAGADAFGDARKTAVDEVHQPQSLRSALRFIHVDLRLSP